MHVIEDVFAETDRLVNSEKHQIRSWWYVTAHTINGSRFYSEPFKSFDDASSYFDDMKNVTEYFGGGSVEMLRINDYDYDVVAVAHI